MHSFPSLSYLVCMTTFLNFSFVTSSASVVTGRRVSNLNNNNLIRSVARKNEGSRNGVLFDRSEQLKYNKPENTHLLCKG